MTWLITKYLTTAFVVVLVSEIAKRSDRIGALVASLPLVTLLTLVWLYLEKQPESKLSNHASYTFWYVVPTLPMFLVFPLLLPRFGFWQSMATCVGLTVLCFIAWALLARWFGIELL